MKKVLFFNVIKRISPCRYEIRVTRPKGTISDIPEVEKLLAIKVTFDDYFAYIIQNLENEMGRKFIYDYFEKVFYMGFKKCLKTYEQRCSVLFNYEYTLDGIVPKYDVYLQRVDHKDMLRLPLLEKRHRKIRKLLYSYGGKELIFMVERNLLACSHLAFHAHKAEVKHYFLN